MRFDSDFVQFQKSQKWNQKIEKMANKIKIPMEKILEQNTMRFISGSNKGQLVIERNLDYMKKWSGDEISEIFDDEGQLKHLLSNKLRTSSKLWALPLTANHYGSRVDMVESTRKHTINALKLIFRDEKFHNLEIKNLGKMARDLISEENIRNKFENCFIEYDLTD